MVAKRPLLPSSSSSKAPQHDKESVNHDHLLTKRALELSLSPPRAPPFGTSHRAVLQGRRQSWLNNATTTASEQEDEEPAWSIYAPRNMERRRRGQMHTSDDSPTHYLRRRRKTTALQSHPHLMKVPSQSDQVTRAMSLVLPEAWVQATRDGGGARFLFDALVTSVAAPTMGLTEPRRAAWKFVQLTQRRVGVPYGPDPRQFLDLYLPKDQVSSNDKKKRLIFFIHGGAWGSGLAWFYRLVAGPFLEQGWTVAILGYRTYPTGRVEEQVEDCCLAAGALQGRGFDSVTVLGHSSGAHVGLLWMVDRAKRRLQLSTTSTSAAPPKDALSVDSFLGLSGPYDISHHFDYEAARGVQEFSPMKAACGTTQAAFRKNSPARRLQEALRDLDANHATVDQVLPRIALIHGVEDDTVPFTSTAEAARQLRACGVSRMDEVYLGHGTGHQDTVLHLMLGGLTRDWIIQWLQQHCEKEVHDGGDDNDSSNRKATHMLIQSRL